ncbi:MAG TPA: hypothetical protein VK402_06555 [Blastococcus sp.]|nr:hypothetical protein [Blastococcus sp.]
MTAVVERRAAPAQATLRTLAWVEARRYARHPVFLLGAGLLVWSSVAISDDLDATFPDFKVAVGFLVGVFGVLVGYQLTRSLSRSTDAVTAAPADGVLRTAALCLACLVPGALGLAWVGWLYATAVLTSTPDSAIGTGDRIAILLAGAVATVGGPLVGVMVGRWTRFPGAGLVAAVLLVLWTGFSSSALEQRASHLTDLARLQAPFAFWTSSGDAHATNWVAGGSPWWHLAYVVLLCGLAATAAMVHEATGGRRTRLWRVLAVLGVLALGCLALAVAGDPTRVPL